MLLTARSCSCREAAFFQQYDRAAVSTLSTLPRYTGRLFIAHVQPLVVFCFGLRSWWAAIEIHVPPKPVCNCPLISQGCDSTTSHPTATSGGSTADPGWLQAQSHREEPKRARRNTAPIPTSSCCVTNHSPSKRRKADISLPGPAVEMAFSQKRPTGAADQQELCILEQTEGRGAEGGGRSPVRSSSGVHYTQPAGETSLTWLRAAAPWESKAAGMISF